MRWNGVFELEYPFGTEDFVVARTGNELPGLVMSKGIEFCLDCCNPEVALGRGECFFIDCRFLCWRRLGNGDSCRVFAGGLAKSCGFSCFSCGKRRLDSSARVCI